MSVKIKFALITKNRVNGNPSNQWELTISSAQVFLENKTVTTFLKDEFDKLVNPG